MHVLLEKVRVCVSVCLCVRAQAMDGIFEVGTLRGRVVLSMRECCIVLMRD